MQFAWRKIMTLNPIINARLNKFKEDFLLSCNDDEAFENFSNYHILSQFQPGVLRSDLELLDLVSAGGSDDLGLDGIAFFLNGQIIRSCDDIDELLSGNKKADFELVFIQSKNKHKFDYGDFLKFVTGVESFLKDNIDMPHNDKIESWHKIYLYIVSSNIVINWKNKPSVIMNYVVNGTFDNAPYITGCTEEFKKRLDKTNSFGDIDVRVVDDKKLIKLIDDNENNYEVVIDIVDSMALPEVTNVDNSRVVLCKATEIIKMITTSDGLLRRNIFDDNVRDFQGNSTINAEIEYTIKNESEKFILLNNGITVVCSEITDTNRKIRLSNPQVVNGCQTCCILFYSNRQGIDLENTFVVVKFIGTNDDEIVNSIVKGTNRQNIVYEEAFAITSEFHKMLEKYFSSMSVNGEKIYYERRSKQFEQNALIKPYQKVNFRVLIQSTVSIFLSRPEEGHKHESTLLNMYKNVLFKEGQSFEFYYCAAFIYLKIEKLFRKNLLPRELYTYKMQIMMLFKELIGKGPIDINKQKYIEKYCDKILDILKDEEKCLEYAHLAIDKFITASNLWIQEKGSQFKDGRKDSAEFTQYLLQTIKEDDGNVEIINVGKVLLTRLNRNNKWYGFIQSLPYDIYFSENDNPNITKDYEGKMVKYRIKQYFGKNRAIDVSLIDNDS